MVLRTRAVCFTILALGTACSGRFIPAAGVEELETDRDSFTFAPTTAGPGLSILEASYSFIENRTAPQAHSYPEILLRRGVGERVEARLGFNYEAGGPGLVSGSEFGVVKIPVGDRWNVHAEYFAIFSSGKQTPLNVQYASFGGHVLATDNLELGLRIGWGLNESSPAFFTNVGVGWRY